MNSNSQPDISVAIITYNQEKYIAQTLESVLMQKTGYSYEIVIGEDCSQDNTRKILARYAEKHPEKINLLERNENLGPIKNIVDVIRRCKGRYIAFLEGDDYWVNSSKLQTQVAFLEENSVYSSCFAGVDVIDENGKDVGNEWPPRTADVLDFESLAGNWRIPTCTVVMRNLFDGNCLNQISQSLFLYDRILHTIAVQHGMMKYIDIHFGVYRFCIPGAFTSSQAISKIPQLSSVMNIVKSMIDDKDKDIVQVELNAIDSRSKFIENKTPNAHKCIICGNELPSFYYLNDVYTYRLMKKYNIIDSDLENYGCPHCSSTDIERHLFIYFIRLNLFEKMNINTKVLHVAPEFYLSQIFQDTVGTYITMDSNAEMLNLLALPYGDNYFDVIMCNHVLERIPDDGKALSEIYRTLKVGGYAILQTPYSPDLAETLPYDERYGQADRVRVYGMDFFEKLKRAGFNLRIVKNDIVCGKEEAFYYGVNSKEDLIMCMKYA